MTEADRSGWPVLTAYSGPHLARVAMPIGGIGTGTISLAGRGNLRDFEIVNRPAKGYRPDPCFFALRVRDANGTVTTRALEGPLDVGDYEGASGSPAANHGLPRFRSATLSAAYPLARIEFDDSDLPVSVALEAFNPLIPGDPDRSGLPTAILRIRLTNRSGGTCSAAVCGVLNNFIGTDGTDGKPANNSNVYRTGDGVAGVFMTAPAVDPESPYFGTVALATPTLDAELSHRTCWPQTSWNVPLLDFWDDFTADGRLDEPTAAGATAPTASLAAGVELQSGQTRTITFVLTWHFPNRLSWSPNGKGKWNGPACELGEPVVGNYYATRFADAWAVAEYVAAGLPTLEADTVSFVKAFCDSDLPAPVKEAALFNLSTLRTETCFRTRDGRFFGWEGIMDRFGSCLGSCTHVWNYEQATPFLFPSLSRSMREIEFLHCTDERGHMSFRAHLPLEHARGFIAAADGQMGCVMKLYRDWQLCGDAEWLRSLWTAARRTLGFCWVPGGWDADRDGVMEGCQHNTMDVEYYGPNAQMTGWYLGALRAAEEIATYLGEADFARECRRLFDKGSAWMDANLFNGDYYEHHIRPPASAEAIADGLRWGSKQDDLSDPDFQLGPACLVDQMVGQYMSHVCGLGHLHTPAKVQTTLQSVLKYNRRLGFWNHFNNMRSYALGDDTALLMASYPRGGRLKRPFPYASEVMTGFEYAAAVGLMYEGFSDEGIAVIEDIRNRYDGARRNPFDEAECGHHYARAMASWAAVLAMTGFHYSAVTQTLRFARAGGPSNWFWSTGTAWGTITQGLTGDDSVQLTILYGELKLKTLLITRDDHTAATFTRKSAMPLRSGDTWSSTEN